MDKYSHTVIKLEVNGTRLERGPELIASSENIHVLRWCAVDDGLSVYDLKFRDILRYSID